MAARGEVPSVPVVPHRRAYSIPLASILANLLHELNGQSSASRFCQRIAFRADVAMACRRASGEARREEGDSLKRSLVSIVYMCSAIDMFEP